jgi:hypothetical protein
VEIDMGAYKGKLKGKILTSVSSNSGLRMMLLKTLDFLAQAFREKNY